MSVFSHLEFDHHEQVAFCHDKKTGLKAIIAVHNTYRGPALGGCRMWPYADEDEALNDALRLSRGMTYKSALANLPLGGGKAVIIGNPRQDKTPELLRALGEFIQKLAGRYVTAEDSGTSVADMKIIGECTEYVSGVAEGTESGGDPSPATAYGTFVGLKAAVKHRLGKDDLSGIKVAIQGVGNVGYHLAGHLKSAGAELFVCDIHAEHVERVVNEYGATAVAPEEIYGLEVDVFAPCAMGAILNDTTLPQLSASVIAGAANNQLATPEHGERLHEMEILYTPDYVINAGGIIDIHYQRSNGSHEDSMRHVESIGETLSEIFTRSSEQNRATHVIADELAEERFQ
ncbi:Glu/Leu/Phe/Val dehydrogenase dimerization domain-containing protein [Marinibactrum halimedae]|uniref:Leucine dehydrogenase n=1 Tax=Marinibactrum halimedae TaxID=1444977 RepID=A0AA37SZX2_9GAMM|nr:Glu/Leu/Phe/Val dehydrogenase dimerization domain-containing protein [Marinibactrum halimedae]MCD9460683.1 amino acid dehydrogenase [Marinibactrum halimedae]GLS24329.1 leucine dehydrogenase [Marinibactrum halimedae]